jgi:enediyne polyketide synthase
MSKQLFKRLKDFRKKQGLSIAQLCEQIGAHYTTYNRWKNANKITGPYKKIVENFLNKNVGLGLDFKNKSPSPVSPSDIAVIGISCYYPGASNVKELWENILSRRVQFRRMLDQRLPLSEYYDQDAKAPEKTYLTKAAFLENFVFDWGKLRIPKKTVESTDIVHWLALDTAIKAFEDAGYKLNEIPLQNTGVIVGNTLTGEQTRSQSLRLRWPYVQKVFNTTAVHVGMGMEERSRFVAEMEQIYKSAFYPITEDSLAGGLANTIAGRICNYLNFKGGGYIVDGACSSSLLSVATAADALRIGNMDLALAGGVDISLDPFELVGFAKAGALARDKMSVYDQSANGFLPGEGCGFVLLKRLEDAIKDKNYIYAVIKGWGISSDGKGGIMEPSSTGQSFAIGRAYKNLNYKISDIDFVEGHGTGTTKGDRVELEGIATAIEQTASKEKKNKCGVTSFKSIVGHTKAAAGVGGLIKAILAVNQRILPPTASCITPNEVFKDKAKNLYPLIQGGVLPPTKIARAGISSAGFGGINCHVTVESHGKPKEEIKPKIEERALFVSQQTSEVFVFTSRTTVHLKKVIEKFKEDLRNISIAEMADLAALLNKKVKNRLPIKVAIVTDSPEHLYDALVLLEQDINQAPIEEGQIRRINVKDPSTRIVLSNGFKKSRIGFLYPGQGSQRVNMTRVLTERFKWAQDLFNLSKLPLYEHIYKATDQFFTKEEQQEFEKQLSDTRITQPAIVISSLIWTEFLSKLGIEPECVAGHSLGELTAFYKAGAFSKEAIIKFAELRGQLMAAQGRSAGSMVSLFCSRQKAEEYVSKIAGNVILANINSPSQMIISGGQKEIEKVIELAQKEEISARRLNVSNAFHSSYMKNASNKIQSSKVLAEELRKIDIDVYLSDEVKKAGDKVNLRSYFSKQVISPVNFIEIVESMSKNCDLLIEVGPGRVLTDLVKAINKEQGPLCLSIESTAQNDRDSNNVLAELFVRNVPVKWEEFYKNRLIRVFVPASRKRFIENQCERPLKIGNQVLKNELLHTLSQGKDLAQSSEEVIPGGLPIIEGKDNIANLLIDLVHQITGYEKESFTLNSRLLDDLNLDSIKASDLIGKAARALGIAGQLDASKFSNNTLGEIRNRLFELTQVKSLTDVQGRGDNVLKRYHDKSWVRNFIPVFKNEEIATRNVNQLKDLKNIVILSESSEDAFSDTISKQFSKVKVQKIHYGEKPKVVKDGAIDCLIAVLHKEKKYREFNADVLKDVLARAKQVVDIATSDKLNKNSFVVLVGFGGGDFGANKDLKDIASCCMKSLVSTLYLEYPDLKVRVLDFDVVTSEEKISFKIIDELQTYDRFSAVGYDAQLNRRVIYYENPLPTSYNKRGIAWSKKDVVLVTGGAKGITAECALEFARSTKVQMVLVGRSPLPTKTDEINEISQTLEKFKKEGLKAYYYQCDVTNEKDVTAVIGKIERKVGKVTGFIHGAGLNSLKRLKQANVDETIKESLPKVMGAVNICYTLKGNLKLVAAITSIIGITGMEGST